MWIFLRQERVALKISFNNTNYTQPPLNMASNDVFGYLDATFKDDDLL
jgi:hypothetical protein